MTILHPSFHGRLRSRVIGPAVLVAGLAVAAGCGSDTEETSVAAAAEADADAASVAPAAGITQVDARTAAELIEGGPDDLVVLDIRTPEEVAAGRVPGAVDIDFYEPDFADRVAALDRSVPYVVYCNSGNRSGAAMQLFDELGFDSVTEVGGGIQAWMAADLPLEQ